MVIAVVVVVILLVVAVAAMTQMRGQRARARSTDALAARASAGEPDAVRILGENLAGSRPRESGELLASTRRHLAGTMAPAIAVGLAGGGPRVAEACAVMLEELGAPGMRAAWNEYRPGAPETGRERLHAFLVRNPDWLARELFDEWAKAGGRGEPPHAELWRDAGLLQRLKDLRLTADPHVAPLAASLLRYLGAEEAETTPAAR